MVHLDVFAVVTKLPANEPSGDIGLQKVSRDNLRKLVAFADALERLVPAERHDEMFNNRVAGLRVGYANCGSAATMAVARGANPTVVLATARLLLT